MKVEVSAIYKGQVYRVKEIDFNNKRVNLNGADIIDLDDKDLKLVFNLNGRLIGI